MEVKFIYIFMCILKSNDFGYVFYPAVPVCNVDLNFLHVCFYYIYSPFGLRAYVCVSVRAYKCMDGCVCVCELVMYFSFLVLCACQANVAFYGLARVGNSKGAAVSNEGCNMR